MARRKRKTKRTVNKATPAHSSHHNNASAPSKPTRSTTPGNTTAGRPQATDKQAIALAVHAAAVATEVNTAPESDNGGSATGNVAGLTGSAPALAEAESSPVAPVSPASSGSQADEVEAPSLAAIAELLQQTVCSEARWEQREQQLRLREAELQRRSDDLRHRRREHARRVRQHRQQATLSQTLAVQTEGFTALLTALTDTVDRQAEQSHAGVAEAIDELESLVAEVQLKQDAIDNLMEDLNAEQRRNRELQAELDQHLCERLFDSPAFETQQETLRQELADAQARLDELARENQELAQQNQELASKLANQNVRDQIASHPGAVNESMSWEERKQLILQRLENEDQTLACGEAVDSGAVRDELQSLRAMVQATDKEITRRDSEIAELRQLLEQQSSTVGDVAIGAAAIAGLLDQDDLVREEREKLQQIQTEWQDKLRQAEIEVSLERARLARERQEIEKRNVELKDRMLERPGGEARDAELDDGGKPARKWLAKLGLDK